jgi:hypothetical protein
MTQTSQVVLRVLVACEKSGRVRDAFRARGHDAWSCDLQPSDTPGPHFQCDARDVLDRNWDLLIAHPPCTYLAASGYHWTVRGFRPESKTLEAMEFVRALWNAPVKHVAIENPVGVLSTRWKAPSQIVHPWMFGSDASKATCFWLRNLPELKPNAIVPPVGWFLVNSFNTKPPPGCRLFLGKRFGVLFGCFVERGETPFPMRWSNQRPDGRDVSPWDEKGAEERAITWPGVARAMAEQWGGFLERLYAKRTPPALEPAAARHLCERNA